MWAPRGRAGKSFEFPAPISANERLRVQTVGRARSALEWTPACCGGEWFMGSCKGRSLEGAGGGEVARRALGVAEAPGPCPSGDSSPVGHTARVSGKVPGAPRCWPPPEVDRELFRVDLPEEDVTRARAELTFGIPGAFLMLYAGRVTAEKDIDFLVRALERSPRNVVLALVGPGSLTEELKQRHGPEQRLHCTGEPPGACTASGRTRSHPSGQSRQQVARHRSTDTGQPSVNYDKLARLRSMVRAFASNVVLNRPPSEWLAHFGADAAKARPTSDRIGATRPIWAAYDQSRSKFGKLFHETRSDLA